MDTGGVYLGDVSSLSQEIVSGQQLPRTELEQQNETNSSTSSQSGVGEQIDVYA